MKKSTSASVRRKTAEARVQAAAPSEAVSLAKLRCVEHELRVHRIELEMQNEELRDARAEIEAGLERYTDHYDFAPSGFFNLNRKGVIRLANLAGATLVNVPRSDLVDRHFSLLLCPSCRESFANIREKVFSTGETQSFESILLPQGQAARHIQLAASRSPDGTECRLVAIDISEAKQARQTLDLRDRALAEVSQGVIVTDENYLIIYANAGFAKLTGYGLEETLGRNCSFLQGPNTSQETIAKIRSALKAKRAFEGEILNYRKDGAPFWNDLIISPIIDAGGGPIRFLGVQRDITQRKESAVLLAESQRRLTLATESAHIGIWEWDVSGDKMIWNDQMSRLCGVSCPDGVASHHAWLQALHHEDRRRIEAEIGTALKHSGEIRTQFRINLPNGSARVLRSYGAVQREDESRPVHLIGVTWDVTEECERGEKLAAALVDEKRLSTEARAGEQAKTQFLAVMSHEVRTPVNGILGFAELLASADGLPRDLHNYARIIVQSSESLLRILDDILNFSRLEAGNVQVETVTFSPRVLLSDIRNLFIPQVTEKGIELIVTVAGGVPEFLAGDAGRLRQILLNLVGNAVKFTKKGRIAICISEPPDRPSVFAFAVKDTGCGILPENLNKIFSPFTQADSTISRRHGGTGLGLAISRHLTEILGGTLTVTSQPNKGAEFVAAIPLIAVNESSAATQTEPSAVLDSSFASFYPLKILLVEDDPVNLKLISILVRRLGYVPITAKNGREALEVTKANHPNCILMDLQMPEMDGIEATRAIRKIKSESRVFVAALTADILQTDRERCMEAGMDDYLNKPIKVANVAAWFKTVSEKITASHPAVDV